MIPASPVALVARPAARTAGVLCALLMATSSATAQFTDRTAQTGLLWFESSWGAAMTDIDLDGDLDIYSGHHFNSPILYWNDGTGNFSASTHPQPWGGPVDRHGALFISVDSDYDPEILLLHGGQGGQGTEANELYRNDGPGAMISLLGAASMADAAGRSRCASAADYNGDGRVDIWVGKAPDGASPNRLFRNDVNFWFNDVGASVGLDETHGTNGGIWGDYDDDGDPDLLVGGEEFPRPTILYRNDGATFTDDSAAFSPPLPTLSGADWGDFDNDGDLDLAACDGQLGIFDAVEVGNPVVYFFNTRHSENGVDGITVASVSDTATAEFRIRGETDTSLVFLGPSEIQPAPGVVTLNDSYVGAPSFTAGVDRGTWVWRASPGGPWEVRCSTPITNLDTFDGWILQKFTTTSVTLVDLESVTFTSGAPRVWRNDGSVFNEISAALGLPAFMVNPRDISWVDFDNDGDLDLHVVDKGSSNFPNGPDKIFRNDGTAFPDATPVEKISAGPDGLGDGAVWGDTDGDGDVDLYLLEGAGPAFYSAAGPARHFVNSGNRGPSLQLDLVGRESGAPAVGTRVTAVVGSLRIHRRVQANAWQGFQDPLRVHVGLNGSASADSLILEWPSGIVDVYEDLPGGLWTLTEGVVTTSAPVTEPREISGWGVARVVPQPARGRQSLQITAAHPVELRVTVHDVAGRLLRHLHRGTVAAGPSTLSWDGRTDDGKAVAAGVYFVRISDGHTTVTRKSTRLR